MQRCFVIGPIGDKFAPLGSDARTRYEEALEVLEKVILPACASNSLDAVRADQIAVSGEITEQVFRHLYEDEVVIADLSGGNPNVMYELGLRHTRDLLTIQIGEWGQLPFDVTAVRTIMFSRSAAGLIDARKALDHALQVGLSEGADPVTATRIWTGGRSANGVESQSLTLSEDQTGLDIQVEEVDSDGVLERMATMESAFPKLTESAEAIGEFINQLGASTEDITREFDVINASGGSAQARLAAVTRFGRTLDTQSRELEQLTGDFVKNMEEIDGGVNGILQFLGNSGAALDEENVAFLDGLIELARSSREGMEGLSQFATVVDGLGGFSKSLRGPGRRMSKSLRSMLDAARLMDEWESAAIRLKAKSHDLPQGDRA